MLDQNTDRNIWMIGAVLVGVAMIIVAKGGFKKTFQSVMDWFSKIITDGQKQDPASTVVALSSIDWGTVAQHAATIFIH